LASKQLQTRNDMIGTVQTQEREGAGGAQPPLNCLTHLDAKTRLLRLNRSSGVQRECSPPELLSLH